jgi:putative hydrolase of the HAD superfamily
VSDVLPVRSRALLFDGDGVVLTGGPLTRALQREHGIDPAPLQPFFRRAFAACLDGAADVRDLLPPYLSDCGWTAGVDTFLQFWFDAERALDETLLAVIDGLRRAGIACYLATNQERHRAAYLRDTLRLAARFDGCFISSEIGARKPSAAYFTSVAEALRPLARDQILLWDDAVANVEGARAEGFRAELYTGCESFLRVLRRYVDAAST